MPDIEVFDFHFHGGNAERVRQVLDGEVSGILCCTNLKCPHQEFEERNQALLKLAREKGAAVLPLLAMVHPNQPDWKEHAAGWFDKYPELVGIKLHPPSSGCEIRPELIDPLFDFVLERGLFVASHTVPVPGLSAVSFFPSLKRRREVRLVIYHASTHEETAYLAESFPNVYVEPTWLGFFPNLFQLMSKLGGYRKMLAGTDGPGWFDAFEGSPYQDLVDKARSMLPDEETLRDFCARNARRFLNMK